MRALQGALEFAAANSVLAVRLDSLVKINAPQDS